MELKRQTLYEAIRDSAKRYPNITALYYQGSKISYKKFLKMVDYMELKDRALCFYRVYWNHRGRKRYC